MEEIEKIRTSMGNGGDDVELRLIGIAESYGRGPNTDR